MSNCELTFVVGRRAGGTVGVDPQVWWLSPWRSVDKPGSGRRGGRGRIELG